jgi:hypothetical protein
MSDMVEVVIDSIRVSLMSQQRIVILREQNAERYLPIWIGVYEAESITIALQGWKWRGRSTTCWLASSGSWARILRVEVVALKMIPASKYRGERMGTCSISVATSDAWRWQWRSRANPGNPLGDGLGGIIPEEDLQEEPSQEERPTTETGAAEEGDERLSVFQDFLEKLDLDNEDEGDEAKDK